MNKKEKAKKLIEELSHQLRYVTHPFDMDNYNENIIKIEEQLLSLIPGEVEIKKPVAAIARCPDCGVNVCSYCDHTPKHCHECQSTIKWKDGE